MMKSLSLLFVLSFCFQYGIAQTKLIAHKRHSGSNFSYALASNPEDIAASNFGLSPMWEIKPQLDSVIFIDEKRAIIIKRDLQRLVCDIDTTKILNSQMQTIRDTVYNHPLFSQQHNLDGIKKALKEERYFKNDIDKVIFIGYDNKGVRKKKSEFSIISFFSNRNNNDLGENGLSPYLAGISLSFVLSLMAYVFYFERAKKLSNA